MQEHFGKTPHELLETMHGVPVATMRRKPTIGVQAGDIFQSSDLYLLLFYLFLAREEMFELTKDGCGAKTVTADRMAVIHMPLTHPYDVRKQRPSAATIARLYELGLGPETRKDRLAGVEKAAARWDVALLHLREGGQPSIILSKCGNSVVPIFETVWTLGLGTTERRDRFHEWTCHRMDQ